MHTHTYSFTRHQLLMLLTGLILYLIPLSPALAKQHLQLHVGEVRPLNVGKVKRVAVGRDDLITTTVLNDGRVLLIPRKEGESDIRIWLPDGSQKNFRVNILEANIHNRRIIAQSLLRAFPKLRVKTVDKHIMIEGKISSVDQQIYENVISKIPNVISLVNPWQFSERETRQLMRSFKVTGLQIRKAGKRLIVHGEVDQRDMAALDTIVSKIPNITSLIKPKRFVREKMVRLKVRMLEIDSNYVRQLGIRWDNDAAGPAFGVSGAQTFNNGGYSGPDWPADDHIRAFVGWTGNLFSRLRLLEQNGRSRTLSEPELVTRSGTEASFNSGGELPVVFNDENGKPSVAFKQYGVNLAMTPQVDAQNNMVISLTAGISSVDKSTQVLGVPGLINRQTQTTINAKHGDTIAISGLFQVDKANARQKTPILGNVPLVGRLFKDTDRSRASQELVILVTPQLVNAANQNETSRRQEFEMDSLRNTLVPLDGDVAANPLYDLELME